MVEDKIRMCDVLSDIEVAQDLLEPKQKEEEEAEKQPHPADEKYASLQADLSIMQPDEEEYGIVQNFVEVQMDSCCLVPLASVPALAPLAVITRVR